jgi:hypothetical protein
MWRWKKLAKFFDPMLPPCRWKKLAQFPESLVLQMSSRGYNDKWTR